MMFGVVKVGALIPVKSWVHFSSRSFSPSTPMSFIPILSTPLSFISAGANGVLSIGIKLMGVEGEKLLDEKWTQDFTSISAPTFTTPNIIENLKLQKQDYEGTPLFYFINPFDSHLLDGIMQGLFSRTQTSPLEVQYYSSVAYLFGEGKAV